MKSLVWLIAVFGVFAFGPTANAAVITVFSNNQAGWTAAAGSPVNIETFTGNVITTAPLLSILSGNGTISSNLYNDVVDTPAVGNNQATFGFTPPITAFGGNFNLTPGGAGSGINFIVTFVGGGTQSVGTEVPNNFNGQFFGFVSDTPITSVQLSGGTQAGAQETFNLDNIRFVSNVPEPATLAAFGVMAVAGFGYVRRRLKGAPVAA